MICFLPISMAPFHSAPSYFFFFFLTPETLTFRSLNTLASFLPQSLGPELFRQPWNALLHLKVSGSFKLQLNCPFFQRAFLEQPLQSCPLSYHPVFFLSPCEITCSHSTFSHLLTDLVTFPLLHPGPLNLNTHGELA